MSDSAPDSIEVEAAPPAAPESKAKAKKGRPKKVVTGDSDAAAAKTPKAPKSPKPKGEKKGPTHAPTAQLVLEAVANLNEKGGSSLIAIKKSIAETDSSIDIKKLSPFIVKFLKTAVAKGLLVQSKGTGARGSFKLPSGAAAKKAVEEKAPKKAAAKAKTPSPKKGKEAKVKLPKKAAAASPKKGKGRPPKAAAAAVASPAKKASTPKAKSPKLIAGKKPKLAKAKSPAKEKPAAKGKTGKKAAAPKKAAPAKE